jgi:parallel beta-helix repeat protein
VIANNVTIEGFMITGATGPGKCGVYLDGVNRCEVSSNIITGNGWGIVLRGSNRNTILGNVLYSLPADGISVRDFSQHNRIINNLLNFNHYGITVLNASNYNLISGNFVNSSDWSGIRLNWFGGGFEPLTDNNITNNILDGNSEGIFLDSPSSNNLVSGNSISNNGKGIRLRQSHNNTIVHNTVTSNAYGAYLESCYNNLIYDNLFENTNNAWDNGANCWNTSKHAGLNIVGGPNIGGNYWMDIVPDPDPEPHIDLDVDDDGLLDYAYNITGDNNRDYLPLVVHDIAVKNVAPSKTVIKKGESVSIIVTVENQGDCVENFSVTVYAARDIIAIRDVTVARRTSLNLEFVWKTRGFATGNYAISAKATPVPPETDTIDNTYIDGCVALTSPVGGVWIPTDKLSLLAPYVALVSTIAVAATATAIYIKRKKKRQ